MPRAAPRPAVGFDKPRNPQSATARKFHTIRGVSDFLDVCDRTVSRWIASGELIAHRLGRSVRIADDDLQVFLARRRGV